LKLSEESGNGLIIKGFPFFGFSALFFTTEDLTRNKRDSLHSYELKKRDFISLNIDLKQMGVGGDDSWGAKPHPQYILPPRNYRFKFKICPVITQTSKGNGLD
jgi:beta-galactosidase